MTTRCAVLFFLTVVEIPGLGQWSGQAQTLYAKDGEPTGIEEEIRWRLNRGRFDSVSENLARRTTYTDVPASSGPLAPNHSLTLAARHHSEDMAKKNMFQHPTIPGSAYYDAVTQPQPWDRMKAEGYNWSQAAENIAAGYSGSEAVYLGWWNSAAHRTGMYGSGLREFGDGYFFWAGSSYQRYCTLDLGSSGTSAFFTDTIFNDANGNGAYEQSEAVAGVAVRLSINGNQHTFYDVASSVGSFAIPIETIANGTVVQVTLSNTMASAVLISIPQSYSNYTTVTLASGESRLYGTFTKSSVSCNFGWREMVPANLPIAPPALVISVTATAIALHWPSDLLLEYQPQRSSNLITWTPVNQTFQAGTGGTMQYSENRGATAEFFRLAVRKR
jgi:hypothetical protein